MVRCPKFFKAVFKAAREPLRHACLRTSITGPAQACAERLADGSRAGRSVARRADSEARRRDRGHRRQCSRHGLSRIRATACATQMRHERDGEVAVALAPAAPSRSAGTLRNAANDLDQA